MDNDCGLAGLPGQSEIKISHPNRTQHLPAMPGIIDISRWIRLFDSVVCISGSLWGMQLPEIDIVKVQCRSLKTRRSALGF